MANLPKNAHGLTQPQETFAQALVRGASQSQAFREAYPTSAAWKDASVWNKASALARLPEVRARCEALRAPVAERVQYNLEVAMREAHDAFEVSRTNRQGGAMVAAAQLRAKLNGLLVDRREISVTQMGDMTPSDKQTLLEAARAALEEKKRQVMLVDNSISDAVVKGEVQMNSDKHI
jgi:hypothetical protein